MKQNKAIQSCGLNGFTNEYFHGLAVEVTPKLNKEQRFITIRKGIILLFLFIFMPICQTNASEVDYFSKAMTILKNEKATNAIPWLDMAMSNSKGKIDPYEVTARLECMFSVSSMTTDFISMGAALKEANKLGGFKFPPQLGGGTSQDKEKFVNSLIQKTDGKSLFSLGLKVMERTNVDLNGMAHGLPYFELAEKKGFKENDLYKVRGMIYFAQGKHMKAIQDLSIFTKTEKAPFMLRLLGISQLIVAKTKSESEVGLSTLKKALSLGDKKAKDIIKQRNATVEHSTKLKREEWADTKLGSDYHTYGYSCNGKFLTVVKSGNWITTWGESKCLLSTTTQSHTIESAAKDAFKRLMLK